MNECSTDLENGFDFDQFVLCSRIRDQYHPGPLGDCQDQVFSLALDNEDRFWHIDPLGNWKFAQLKFHTFELR